MTATTFSQPSSGDLGFLERLSLDGRVEAAIFATNAPLKISDIIDILQDETLTTKDVNLSVERLSAFYKERNGGFHLVQCPDGGFQFQTVPAARELMKRMFSQRPRPLSRAAQETLTIIAYRQPVTRSDIEFIRGVDAGSILKNLLERGLVRCVGRRDIAGRPMMFGTTDEFLRVYQISCLDDLPPIEAFQPSQDVVKKALGRLEMNDVQVDDLVLGQHTQ